jgi:ATP-binding cassette subfamily F protein 3
MMYLNLSDITKVYNGEELFSGVSFSVEKGDKIGLVGINGAGKTTLFKILMGEVLADGGDIHMAKDTKISYMEQHACNESDKTVHDEVMEVFAPVIAMEEELKEIRKAIDRKEGDLDELVRRQFSLNERYEQNRGFVYKSLVRSCLLGLGFREEDFSLPVSALSGGQKTRVLLAKILLSGSNLLLLDEPTNHLDIQSVMWLEDFLKGYDGALMVISHDRYFLDKVTNRTFEMENGKLTVYPGNYTKYIKLREESLKTRQRAYNNTMAEINRLEESAQELRRFNREKTVKRAESKDKQIEKLRQTLDKVETVDSEFHFSFSPTVSGGNEVLKVKEVSKAFGSKVLFQNANMFVGRGDRVFLLGPNGCGKTTLLKMILRQESIDEGRIVLGTNVEPAYYEQTGASLLNGKTVINEVWDEYPRMTQTEIRSALAAFLFKGEDVFKEVSMLSGGERARVALLKIMLKRANLLILDEPTNHLDISSREALEEALLQYEGTILCVSHDRYFINKLASKIYDMKPEGLTEYIGDYDNYMEKVTQAEKAQEEQKAPSEQALDYRARKELESRKRKAATALKRAEELVTKLEEQLEEKNQLLCTDEVANDYEKAMEITKEAQALEQQLEEAMEAWEQRSQEVEELGVSN